MGALAVRDGGQGALDQTLAAEWCRDEKDVEFLFAMGSLVRSRWVVHLPIQKGDK